MTRRVLDALYVAVLVLLLPWLCWRAWRTGRYRQYMRERLRGYEGEVPTGAVWFHGVSVGEVVLLKQLVAAFRARHQVPVIVSTTTDTGLEEARKHFTDIPVIPFPFDFSWATERTLKTVQPSLVVLAESELWPNFILTAKRLNIPLAIANGRMSPRSLGRYALVAPLVRGLFSSLDVVCVQTEEYAAGVLSLGGTPGRVVVTGNVKYDGAILDRGNPKTTALRELLDLRSGELIWIAGSTQTPEEDIALRIYRTAKERHPKLRLFLVPRHRERFDEVTTLVRQMGLGCTRRSALTGTPPVERDIIVVDSIGELSALWGLADVAFVGGSLDGKRGGQNMIEPAAFGAAVTFGPHVWNFKDIASRLCQVGGAVQVGDGKELEDVILRLLGDANERKLIGAAGRAFVLTQQGATTRTLDQLAGLLAKPTAAAA